MLKSVKCGTMKFAPVYYEWLVIKDEELLTSIDIGEMFEDTQGPIDDDYCDMVADQICEELNYQLKYENKEELNRVELRNLQRAMKRMFVDRFSEEKEIA